jgi:hypothetical protein
LVLLSFEKLTNTNTIPAFGMVFQYNTIRIVHLCPKLTDINTTDLIICLLKAVIFS